MTKKITFTLPFPPSINKYYGCGKTGIRYLLSQAKDYPWLCEKAFKDQKIGKSKITKKVKVTRHLYPPDNRKRDEDNYIKALNDALWKCGIIKDDSQIDNAHNYWHRENPKKPGRVEIEIEVID